MTTVVNIFGASSGQFRRPAPAGRWRVATGESPWEREVESPPAPSGAADGRDRSMGHTYSAMQFGYVRRISVAPPGLVCFPCLWSTGSRPWLPAQVPMGPKHDRRVGSGRITKHGIHRHLGLSEDVYSSGRADPPGCCYHSVRVSHFSRSRNRLFCQVLLSGRQSFANPRVSAGLQKLFKHEVSPA